MKTLKYVLLITFAILCFTGCSVREKAASYAGAEKYTASVSGTVTVSCGDEEYTISDAITVSCGDRSYAVLEKPASDDELGSWIGRVDSLEGNVFVTSVNAGPDGEVFVMVNGVYYHAKPVDALTDKDVLLKAAEVNADQTDSALE